MPDPDFISPEGSTKSWKWMISEEELEELEKKYGKEED